MGKKSEGSANLLFLVGIGVSDEQSLTLAGLSALQSCGKVFAESYTNLLPAGAISRIETLICRKIEVLTREQVEGEKPILESALLRPTALLVAGDPMIATTHVSLLLSAKKRGISTSVIHSSSILSAAIGESGLQAYKFGKTATLAYWRENYSPLSSYEVAVENSSRGAHTLLLLDIDEAFGPMPPSIAAKTLLKMEDAAKSGIFTNETKLVLLSAIGREGQTVRYCSISELAGGAHDSALPAVLILPAKLHFLEEEFLRSL